ncbi:complement receptor type 1-like isoform X2 [Etheostoma cragini]|uniref:complement receptor type 1-like isoform X2 n=1 Tax=Etheostoma cragini TaxID=417921 RepID=UPI00155F530B|nr:complement receptor type 1-like isoform X2 [Etheostoma cragini]
MRNVGWTLLVLAFALLASAQVPKECSAPPEHPYTRLVEKYSSTPKFSSGEKVYYNCAEDMTPSTGNRAVQCVGGKWTKLTLKCEKRSCGNAGELLNGEFHYEGNSFIGEKVYAICNDGYAVKGLNYMICKKSGWTGDFPACEERETTCSTPAVANSVSSAGGVSVHRMGDGMTFTCSQGFQLDGAQRVTCGPGGVWQPQPPRCLPSQHKTESPDDKRGCGMPVKFHNSKAVLSEKYITRTSFTSGERVHYVCEVGYIPAGGSRYCECTNGKWTPLRLKCERKPCGSAGELINGQFAYTGVQFGDTATAVCDVGYNLVGQATRNCMSQGWDGRVPACEAVVCEEPPRGTNAEISNYQEPPYTYRSVIRYRCRAGTLIGQRHIWCTENGTWSDPAPTCKEMTCASPNVPNAYWTRAHVKMYQDGDTISIECYPGYAKIGPSTVTCSGDGRWLPGLPKCTPRRRRYWS